MSSKHGNIKTKIKDIVKYWSSVCIEDERNFDWCDANHVCWRCGCERRLQRCHIIPDSLGGKDEPSNFVLLCSECHQEAPNVEDKQFMWDWIRSDYSPFYNTYWQKRAMEEYKRIYQKDFAEELKERNIVTDHAFSKFWNLKTGKTSYHFGHPYGNVATITGNYKMHLDIFDNKYPNGKYLGDEQIKLEKEFESLTFSICTIAQENGFSVWEGATKNPYSLTIFNHYVNKLEHIALSIKMEKNGNYKMCFTNKYNPNYISKKEYTIDLPNDNKQILDTIESQLKKWNILYEKSTNTHPFFSVVSPYWSRINADRI